MGIDLPLCSEDINNILETVIEKEKLKNPKIELSSGSKVGEGYLGINCSVEIIAENKTLHLFIKAAPKHQKLRQRAQIRLAYQNEFRFFNNIYPIMEEFYKKRTGKSLDFIAKFYAGNIEEMNEIFVLEDLKHAGFDLNGTYNVYNIDQLLAIVKVYGRFHGVSFALKDQEEKVFGDESKNLSDFFSLIFNTLNLNEIVKAKCKIMEKYLQSPEDKRLLQKVKYISENVEDLILKIRNFEGEHRIILHGDCNHNNIMLRKQDNSLDVRLLDFQAIRLNSPVLDLSYLIYAASLSEENLAQFDLFLDTYYESLSHTIKELGSDPEKLCPLSAIKEHWKTFSVFGLLMSFLLLSSVLDDPNKTTDIVEYANSDSVDVPARSSTNEEEYAKRIKYLLKHLVDNEFI